MIRFLAAITGAFILKVLRATWKIRITGPEPETISKSFVYVFWHGNQSGLLAYPEKKPVTILVSNSKDGNIQAQIMKKLGFNIVRGSSGGEGSIGLKKIISKVQKGFCTAFAVDGSRGPLHKAKPGASYVAVKTSCIIIPISFKASKCWIFKNAWDKYKLPKPFSKVEIIRGNWVKPAGTTVDITSKIERELKRLDAL